jgi:hypothetical protein
MMTPRATRGPPGIGEFHDTWRITDATVDKARDYLDAERSLAHAIGGLANDPDHFDRLADVVEGGYVGAPDEGLSPAEQEGLGDFAWDIPPDLGDLEIGVVGLTCALNADGLVTAASCRGHVGPAAWSPAPVVSFAATQRLARALQPLAAEASCTFFIDDMRPKLMVVYGRSILSTMALGEAGSIMKPTSNSGLSPERNAPQPEDVARSPYGRRVTHATSVPGLPERYARWQERLAELFFAGREDQPVVLFVDRDELQRLAQPGEDGARSLASAVREVVDVRLGTAMFWRASRLQKSWRQTGAAPPPTLPILALSVLAASEMRSDASARRHAYYLRLARSLLPDGAQPDIDALLHLLRERGAFLAVVEMWEQLDRWLGERAGAFGKSTIRGDPEQTRIGYPLSQTLVRRSDRAALTRFFAKLNLKSSGVPGPDSLTRMLQLWTGHHGHGLTDRFVQSLTDPDVRPILTPLLHDLATAWDGKIITAEGLRRLDLRLTVDLVEPSAWWVVPAVRDIAEDVLKGTLDGHVFESLLITDPHSSLYDLEHPPPVTGASLRDGVLLRGSNCIAEFQPAELIVLSENRDAGGWMSADALQPYEEHVFVVSEPAAAGVERTLRTAADGAWNQLSAHMADRLFGGGFAIFEKVTFSDESRLEEALRSLPGAVAAYLRVGTTARPRLINGLPLLRNVTRSLYLCGGEPDLVLPVGPEPRFVDVTLDGVQERLRAWTFPIPLRRVGGFTEGMHKVEADGETLTFDVARGAVDDRASTDIGSLAWTDGTLQTITDDALVRGAVTSESIAERPILARRNSQETWLIHRNGRMTSFKEPPAPPCLPELNFTYVEVDRDAGVWLAQKRAAGWMITKLKVQEPAFQDLTADERRRWDELVASVHVDDPVWAMYTRAWGRYRAR